MSNMQIDKTANNDAHHKVRCFCGDVQFALEGDPQVMAYCHCDSCRQWSAGPLSAFTLWKSEDLRIIKGADRIAEFRGNPLSASNALVSRRKWCKSCGGHIFTEHPAIGMTDVPAVLIDGLIFEPAFHVHYQESRHPMKDGLPKFRDLPAEAGGSGGILQE